MSLDLIKKEDINRKIKKEFNYSFRVEQSGIYAIVVSAKARSWFQNVRKFVSVFSDDNLAVKINVMGFPKLSGERGNFNGEASWNGNKLKGLRQVNLFVAHLNTGEQNLKFISKGAPVLKLIEIYRVSENRISIDPSKYNIEDGDKRPWFNALTNNIGFVSVSAKAIASSRSGDDNDLQIRINGVREQNNEPKAHKYWFWCGRVSNGQSKTFERTISLRPGTNYIEFWADGIPIFSGLNIHVTMSLRIPTVDDPVWTGDFYDDSEEMILARLIFGEARNQSEEARLWVAKVVLNRVESKGWSADTIHGVILDPGQFAPFKSDDKKNYPRIIDPLDVPSETSAWKECYKIAEKAINGSLSISTEATHFHSYTEPKDIEWFERNIVPNGKFLKKIGDIYFYWSPN